MAAKQYELTLETSTEAATLVADATPATAADGRLRVVWGCDSQGRGASATIKPLSADTQFVLHSVRLTVIPSLAGVEDA
jgi:hypothetical protein